jgi:hypothetical protein
MPDYQVNGVLVLFFKKEQLSFTFYALCHRLESGKELAQKQG